MAKLPPRHRPTDPLGERSAGSDVVDLPKKKATRGTTGDATARKLATTWQANLTRADKKFDKWVETYHPDRLLRYYLGQHWQGLTDAAAQEKYVINLIFATIETQIPSLLFTKPRVTVDAQPSHALTPGSDAAGRARLIEDTLQTYIDDRKVNFKFETALALRDVFWQFALIEVGYTADWIDNPHADKPVLKDDDSPMLDSAGEAVRAPKKLPKPGSECLFVKRLPPGSFRVSPGRNAVLNNDWAGYFEWHYLEDVKQNPDYQHTADLTATGRLASVGDAAATPADDADPEDHQGQVKIWKIWDFRRKVRHVLAEGHPLLLQANKPYTVFPIAPFKLYEIPDAWYPLPPVFNWIGPQDELNESREMQRVHRRRATRRYMREPSVKKEEFEKLETGEDMVCIEVPKVNPPPIAPIPDAPLDAQNWQQLAATHQDLDLVTGVSGEGKGVAESDTATQANIINTRAELRESSARVKVAEWLGDIARLMLLTLRDSMQLPFMVKRAVDPWATVQSVATTGTVPPTTARTLQQWQEVKASDVDDLDVDVKIDVASLSPVAEQAQRSQWFLVLQLLTNQPLMLVLFQPNPEAPNEPSPLLRHTLALNGVKSDQEVREIWRVGQAALQQMIGMQLAAQASKGGGAGMPMLGGAGMQSPAQPAIAPTGTPTAGPLGVQ